MVEIDIKDYFDTIDLPLLIKKIEQIRQKYDFLFRRKYYAYKNC